jgi:hypothetical protein
MPSTQRGKHQPEVAPGPETLPSRWPTIDQIHTTHHTPGPPPRVRHRSCRSRSSRRRRAMSPSSAPNAPLGARLSVVMRAEMRGRHRPAHDRRGRRSSEPGEAVKKTGSDRAADRARRKPWAAPSQRLRTNDAGGRVSAAAPRPEGRVEYLRTPGAGSWSQSRPIMLSPGVWRRQRAQ